MPAARRGKQGGGGLASKLFDKFDSDRKYDPFLDTDPVIQDSKEGMVSALLCFLSPRGNRATMQPVLVVTTSRRSLESSLD